MRLPFRLEPGIGEMPSDFTSRLGARNHRDDFREFCADFGLDAAGIRNGDESAVARLADLAEVDAVSLQLEAYVRRGKDLMYKGQTFRRSSLLRSNVRLCPACAADDLERGSGREHARVYRRSTSLIRGVKTCATHGIALTPVGGRTYFDEAYNISDVIADGVRRLAHLQDSAISRKPSGFERYIADRLNGNADGEWLDSMPMYAALHLCFVAGAVDLHGPKVTLDDLDDHETWHCEATGFELASRGPHGLRDLLDRLQADQRHSISGSGPKTLYGRLYDWLAHESDDDAYDPVRDVIFDHSVETLPLGPSDRVFGREVEVRKVHSVRTASLEYGLHPKRTRKVLARLGLTGDGSPNVVNKKVTVEANAAAAVLAELVDTMPLEQIREYLNVPRPHDRGLFERGFLTPMIRGGGQDVDHAFRKRDLDDLLARLLQRADPSNSLDAGFVPLVKAAKRCCRSVMDVVGLVLDNKLERVGIDLAERGFKSILVDTAEVRSLLVDEQRDEFSLKEVEKLLRMRTEAVKALVEHGILGHVVVKNPVTGWMQPLVRSEEIDRFRAEFVTLHELSRERGDHFLRVKKALSSAGVAPVGDPKQLNVTLYQRADINPQKFSNAFECCSEVPR